MKYCPTCQRRFPDLISMCPTDQTALTEAPAGGSESTPASAAAAAAPAKEPVDTRTLEEKLFALVHNQLEYLAPYERFIGSALIHALKPSSPLGPFSHRAMELRHRYLRFVEELIEESIPKKQNPLGFLAPEVFWIYYMGALLYWLYDSSAGKQNTLAFLDRSLSIGASMLKQGKR